MRAVTFFDGEGLRDGTLALREGVPVLIAEPAPPAARLLMGTVTGLFTDHHVHLQLVDHTQLAASRLGRVVDLGADPAWIAALSGTSAAPASALRAHISGEFDVARPKPGRIGPSTAGSPELCAPVVQYAGPFLTAPGGYPSDRVWAPAGSVREIADTAQAIHAVDELAAAGVSLIKIALHGDAGPVLDDEIVAAIVAAADRHQLAIVAHAEGTGQAQRAARLGATLLAHAPFSERLDDDEIATQAASTVWISTLAVHEGEPRATAIDNVRRFMAAGGELRYGTDMGNGDTPVDLRTAEIDTLRAAGVDHLSLLRCLCPADPLRPGAPLLLLSDGDPNRARRFDPADVEADLSLDTTTDPTEP